MRKNICALTLASLLIGTPAYSKDYSEFKLWLHQRTEKTKEKLDEERKKATEKIEEGKRKIDESKKYYQEHKDEWKEKTEEGIGNIRKDINRSTEYIQEHQASWENQARELANSPEKQRELLKKARTIKSDLEITTIKCMPVLDPETNQITTLDTLMRKMVNKAGLKDGDLADDPLKTGYLMMNDSNFIFYHLNTIYGREGQMMNLPEAKRTLPSQYKWKLDSLETEYETLRRANEIQDTRKINSTLERISQTTNELNSAIASNSSDLEDISQSAKPYSSNNSVKSSPILETAGDYFAETIAESVYCSKKIALSTIELLKYETIKLDEKLKEREIKNHIAISGMIIYGGAFVLGIIGVNLICRGFGKAYRTIRPKPKEPQEEDYEEDIEKPAIKGINKRELNIRGPKIRSD